MSLSVPSATDNIYKFYTIFGLTLIVASILGLVHVVQSGNAKVYQLAKDYDTLVPKDEKEQKLSATGAVIDEMLKQHGDDQFAMKAVLYGVLIIGGGFTGRGFHKWRKEVQPMDTRLKELQIKRLEQEVEED